VPVLKALGLRNLARFAKHKIRIKTGYYALRSPIASWTQCPIPARDKVRNPFSPMDLDSVRGAIFDPDAACRLGDRIASREILYFSHHLVSIPSSWRANPHTQFETAEIHWSLIPDFWIEQGDIKWIWEPSRFDWVYSLARAYGASSNEKYPEAFWRLFEDWRRSNPPNMGVNWKCGQESSFKMFALAFAHGAFLRSAASTPERVDMLWQTFRKLAQRVDLTVDYALSQRNNHGISEAVALYLAGQCLPGDVEASYWKNKGKQLFESQVLDQFFDDGAYIQHSFTYERLALRAVTVFCVTAKICSDTISPDVLTRLNSAIGFMASVVDPATGMAPNYGANDGANIFALNGCGYRDFRPVIQTLSCLLFSKRVYGPGSWDEELSWLGLKPKGDPILQSSFAARTSGYFGLRGNGAFGLIRCHSYSTRPGHADMLALDIWMNGNNIIPDAGTFQYYDVKDVGSFLKCTPAHSTVEVNEHSQMFKSGRFLWLDWTRAKTIEFDADRGVFVGEHYGYLKSDGLVHRRTILMRNGDWLVIDDLILSSNREALLTLRWRINSDGSWHESDQGANSDRWNVGIDVTSSANVTTQLIRGSADSLECLESHYYGEVNPVDLVKSQISASKSIRWLTTIGRTRIHPVGSGIYSWHGVQISDQPNSPPENA